MEITHDVEYSWEEYSRGLLSASLTLSSTLISNIHIERILLKIFHLFAFIIILSHWQRMPSSTASRQHLLYVFTLICLSSTHATHVSLFLCVCVSLFALLFVLVFVSFSIQNLAQLFALLLLCALSLLLFSFPLYIIAAVYVWLLTRQLPLARPRHGPISLSSLHFIKFQRQQQRCWLCLTLLLLLLLCLLNVFGARVHSICCCCCCCHCFCCCKCYVYMPASK